MDWRTLRLRRDGIQFVWHGDDVLWLFPWNRISGRAWISFGFDASFNSLREIDDLWDEYFEADKRA